MREPENLRCVEMLDVDYLGFVFYAQSPRYVPEEYGFIEAFGHCTKNKVGVFVNESIEKMLCISKLFQFNYLQLHGNETPEICCELRQKGYSIIKAFPVTTSSDFNQTKSYQNCCDYYLFDASCAGYGGSGKRFDWSLLDAYKGEIPFLLSGGLTFDCVADIKRLKHPQFFGVDLNSGFELYPAMKDVIKLKDFINELKKNYYNEQN